MHCLAGCSNACAGADHTRGTSGEVPRLEWMQGNNRGDQDAAGSHQDADGDHLGDAGDHQDDAGYIQGTGGDGGHHGASQGGAGDASRGRKARGKRSNGSVRVCRCKGQHLQRWEQRGIAVGSVNIAGVSMYKLFMLLEMHALDILCV